MKGSWYACALLLACAGCGESAPVREIGEGRDFVPVPRRSLVQMPAHERFGYSLAPQTSSSSSAPASFAADAPDGWVERAPTSMRVINYAVGAVECYVTPLLGGPSAIAENVNRWRGQVGLGALSRDDVAALPRRTVLGREAALLEVEGDFTGMGGSARAGYKLVGLVCELDGRSALSIKMVGPATEVDAQLSHFFAFAKSLRAAPGSSHPKTGSSFEPPPSPKADFSWAVPENWTPVEHSSSMRAVTFRLRGDGDAECAVFVFANVGDERSNLIRWYGEMGKQPPADLSTLEPITILGQECRLADVKGPYQSMTMPEPRENFAMLAVYCRLPEQTVCVKLTGPADLIAAERGSFLAFCKSLRRTQ